MKDDTPSPGNKKRFSRERIAVISAISFLVLFLLFPRVPPVYGPAQKKKAQALRTATELRYAILNYHGEYQEFPASMHDKGATWDTSSASGLMPKLLGDNSRGILFFHEERTTATGQSGLWYPEDDLSTAELLDPWGQPYQVIASESPQAETGIPTPQVTAVWSTGPDKKSGGSKTDDLYAR